MSTTFLPVSLHTTRISRKHNEYRSLLFQRQHAIHTIQSAHISRRELLFTTTIASATPLDIKQQSTSTEITRIIPQLETELDVNGKKRIKLRPEGYNTYQWRSHNINWLSAGEDNTNGPIVVLIHGFGASVYHYRYLIPQLVEANCRVFAVDCLGFGWSDKALVQYDGYSVWSDQISDFIRHVVHSRTQSKEKVVLVGNSLGGYNSMATAAGHPDLIRGVVLLNAAGRFDTTASTDTNQNSTTTNFMQQQSSASFIEDAITAVSSLIKRMVVAASFIFTKQPARVRQVLGQVYTDKTNIDDDLVKSIVLPADDPNASEVFYRIITGKGIPMNILLDKMKEYKLPVFLLWGQYDPWCVPARADQIEQYYPYTDRVDVNGGHCVHDEIPDVVSKELLKWMSKLA